MSRTARRWPITTTDETGLGGVGFVDTRFVAGLTENLRNSGELGVLTKMSRGTGVGSAYILQCFNGYENKKYKVKSTLYRIWREFCKCNAI